MFGKWLSVLFIVGFASGCAKPNYQNPSNTSQTLSFPDQKLNAEISWEKTPTDSDFGSFYLSFHPENSRDEKVDPPSTPIVFLWMPDMGHGSSPVKLERVETGVYHVTRVFFIMHGQWEIVIQLKDPSNSSTTLETREKYTY